MKKFYKTKFKSVAALSLALLANVAFAQDLKVTSNGNPVSNGDIIDVECVFEDYTQDFGFFYLNCVWDPNLEVSTSEGSTTLNVTLSKVDNLPSFEICWPDQCINFGPDGTAKTSGTISTTPETVDIHIIEQVTDENDSSLGGGMSKVYLTSSAGALEFTLKALPVSLGSVGENIADNKVSEYYTIQGVRVAEPQKGQLYIVRKGSKVAKHIF